MSTLAPGAPAVRRLALLGAVLLAFLSATGARHWVPALHDVYKGRVGHKTASRTPIDFRVRALAPRGGGGTTPAAISVVAHVAPPSPRTPRLVRLLTPASVPHGAYALGGSVPKARRHLVLGGHGRHGAG